MDALTYIEGLYYGYKLGKDIMEKFKKSSTLPTNKGISTQLSLVVKFKPDFLPKFKDVEKMVFDLLKKHEFIYNKGIIKININGKSTECAIEYNMTVNPILSFEEMEREIDEIYELSVVDDFTLKVIPKLQGLTKEEALKTLSKVYSRINEFSKKFIEKFNIKKSTIWMKLYFDDVKKAKNFYNRLIEKLKKQLSESKPLQPEELTDGAAVIEIRDVDLILIQCLFSKNFLEKLEKIKEKLRRQ